VLEASPALVLLKPKLFLVCIRPPSYLGFNGSARTMLARAMNEVPGTRLMDRGPKEMPMAQDQSNEGL
jgi:hypothetical protein